MREGVAGLKQHEKSYVQWLFATAAVVLMSACGAEGVDGLPAEPALSRPELEEAAQHDEGLRSSPEGDAVTAADSQQVLTAAQTFLGDRNQPYPSAWYYAHRT